jgi:hypothetical protein
VYNPHARGGQAVDVTESILSIRGHRGSTAVESILVEGVLLFLGKCGSMWIS